MLPNKTKDYLMVVIQLLLFTGYIFCGFELTKLSLPKVIHSFGLAFALVGALLLLWSIALLNKHLSPFPSPRKSGKLITYGPYSLIRHPIYAGILAIGFGVAIYFDSSTKLLINGLLWLLFYFKSNYEEKLLRDKFPKYTAYLSRTGRFLPKL